MKLHAHSVGSLAALAVFLGGCAQTGASPEVPLSQAPAPAERTVRGNLVLESVPATPADISERLSAYENVRSHVFLDWTGEGGVLVTTRFGETNQLHEVKTPGGARRQLTFFTEPVGNAAVSPAGGGFPLRA